MPSSPASPVLVLNGPNIGRLGLREPHLYGATTYADLATSLREKGSELGLDVDVRQTDAEHEMLGWLHAAADEQVPVVLNPAGWSHTSVALRDACAALTAPLVEVHITNIHAREVFRHNSFVSGVATGVIAGLGVEGYALALGWIAARAAAPDA